MQFDTYQAYRTGIGGIVWSEHIAGYDQRDSVVVEPGRGAVDPDSLHVTGLVGDVTRMGAVRSGAGSISSRSQENELVIAVSGGTPAQPTKLQYFTQHIWIDGVARWPETLRFNRPISSGAKLEIDYRFCDTRSTAFHVVVRLSWHVDDTGAERQHGIHYVLHRQPVVESREIEAPGIVRVDRAAPTSGRLVLDLLEDASFLPDGDDNTLVDISWYVEATGTDPECVAIKRVVLRSDSPAMEHNWRESERIGHRYHQRYDVMQFTGFEGWVVNGALASAGFANGGRAGAHMNVLFPSADPPELASFLPLGGRELVRAVHSNCGIAAINHPFCYDLLRAGTDSASRRAVRARVFDFLLAQRAFGADLMEVGLPARGDGLDVHLLLWDRLNSSGLRLCGIGTSDTHGWRWDNPATASWTENRNPYVTWLWLRGRSQADVVSSLRRCRAFFGDPFQFTGTLDLVSEPTRSRMGSTVRATADSMMIRPVSSGLGSNRLWLVHVLTSHDDSPHYLLREDVTEATHAWIQTRQSSFVRLEVRTTNGEPIAFSNPIWIQR